MPLITTDAVTGDVVVGFNFEVVIEGKLSGYFTECNGLGSESEVTEHKLTGSGDREAVRKVPGRHKWGDITLKRGVTTNQDIYQWRQMIIDGQIGTARSGGSIKLYDQAGTLVGQWDIDAAWPSKLSVSGLSSESSSVVVEELTIVHEGIRRVV